MHQDPCRGQRTLIFLFSFGKKKMKRNQFSEKKNMKRIFRKSFSYPFQVSSECTCMCDTRSKQSNTHTPCLPFFLFWREVRQCLSQRWASNLPVHLCLFTRMQRDAYVGEQQAAALIYKEIYTARRRGGKQIKETEQHKMAGSNVDELLPTS